MKYMKLFRILGIVIIMSLLVVAIPASPALAAKVIEIDPGEGKIGDSITVTGTGFSVSTDTTNKYVDVYFTLDGTSTSFYINNQVNTYKKIRTGLWIDEDGAFTYTLTVPEKLDGGSVKKDVETGVSYYICVTVEYFDADNPATRLGAIAKFNLVGGEITLDPEEGPVDTQVEITGTDFAVNTNILIEYDGSEVDIEDGDSKTDSRGEFESVILIPESTAGVHTITVTVSGSEAEAEFTVTPDIILEPQSGEVGASVAVSGTGFAKGKDVTIYFKDVGLATKETSRYGSFTTTFTVPDLAAGVYDIDAEDDDGNLDKAKFTVTVPATSTPTTTPPTTTPPPTTEPTPSPTTGALSPTATGPVGTNLFLSGTGFKAGGAVTIKYDDNEVATAKATADGILIAAFKVPVSKYGEHTVTASDGTSTLKLTFTVESEAPKTPAPLLPEMGVKLKSPMIFDWADVTDDSSPVTYTLQIATDKNFGASSVMLEKKGLAKSEYTLTEEEETKLTGEKSSYYWRVRAIDAASNEGVWTGAGEFNVAVPFSIPKWALYTIIGIGGLLLFGIGYFLGRRSALYF